EAFYGASPPSMAGRGRRDHEKRTPPLDGGRDVQLRRNSTEQLFAGMGTTASRTKPAPAASAVTSSSSRTPHAGFRARSEASKATLLGAGSAPPMRNGP